MKFKNVSDEIQYNLLNLNEMEVRKRLTLATVSKDQKKSRGMKNMWRRDKHKIMKGLKKWNKSTAGKRFHRALGRYNSVRIHEGITYGMYNGEYDTSKPNIIPLSMSQVNDAALGLSSIETHLFLELQYYESDPEAMIQFLDIIKNFIEDSSYLKVELLNAYISGVIEQEAYLLLTDIIQFFANPKSYIYAKRELLGLSNDTKTEDFLNQVKVAEEMDLSKDSNLIYEELDKLFVDIK